MKKFVLKTILFFALAALLDVVCGWSFDVLKSKARGGQTYKNEYLFNTCKDDILILGSSRANHHYVPRVMTDSLGLSCYNAGEQGCGIIPAYVRYQLVSERRKPKLVLYEVTPGYDYLEDKGGYSNYVGAVRQYADNEIVKKMYLDFSDELESLRLLSAMYRNNSCIIKNVKDIVKPTPYYNGYDPLYGKISLNRKTKNNVHKEKSHKAVDSLKFSYMERLVEETKREGVPMAFIISPFYESPENATDYEPVKALSKKYGIPLIDNSRCDLFVGNAEYFQDNTHLNHQGAVAYTQYVIPQIKDIETK